MSRGPAIASLSREQLPEGKPCYVLHPPLHIVVVRLGDEVFALESVCAHAGASLLLGKVERASCSITCRAHGYRFDLRTGELLERQDEPCRQRAFSVIREGDRWLLFEPGAGR
jgi:nitrite reductase/ring-hydroxylating ferredoxin subunit